MARRSAPAKREILPDPVYNSLTVTKFVNILMERGKKATAERILYGALEIVAKKSGEEALEVFKKALTTSSPSVEVKSRRVGGATYQVPVEVHPEPPPVPGHPLAGQLRALPRRRQDDAREAGRRAAGRRELRGGAVKKQRRHPPMAEANKAFAHYRW